MGSYNEASRTATPSRLIYAIVQPPWRQCIEYPLHSRFAAADARSSGARDCNTLALATREAADLYFGPGVAVGKRAERISRAGPRF